MRSTIVKKVDSTLSLVVELQEPGTLLIKLSSTAGGHNNPPSIDVVRDALDKAAGVRLLSFESIGVTAWDSRFVAFIHRCAEFCRKRNVEFQDDGLPQGVRRLLRLAQAVPEQKDARPQAVKARLVQRLGESAINGWQSAAEMFRFLGENLAALANLLRGRTQFRW